VPLQPVIAQVVDELRAIAPDRTIISDIAIVASVDCDPGQLGQLVSNLLGNAITHGSANSPVRLEAQTTESLLRISVSNGGEPISDMTRANLFQPFFRGNVSGDQQGLGLGLFIADQIARAHGGDLSVRSSPEETRFDFVMPLLSG
jgi:phosphoserine phosphatase RsbU/P